MASRSRIGEALKGATGILGALAVLLAWSSGYIWIRRGYEAASGRLACWWVIPVIAILAVISAVIAGRVKGDRDKEKDWLYYLIAGCITNLFLCALALVVAGIAEIIFRPPDDGIAPLLARIGWHVLMIFCFGIVFGLERWWFRD